MTIEDDLRDLEAANGGTPWGDIDPGRVVDEAPLEDLFSDAGSARDVQQRAALYLAARQDKDAIERQLSQANKSLESCETDLLRAMDRAGLLSAKVDGPDGVPVTVSAGEKAFYSLKQGLLDDPSVVEWLRESGGTDIVKATVHHMTFRRFCRELEEAGKPIHPSVTAARMRAISVKRG